MTRFEFDRALTGEPTTTPYTGPMTCTHGDGTEHTVLPDAAGFYACGWEPEP